ncbi:hypothetical protein CEXT_198931 [Caerostris extrusa]|uniref:Uncharacterized protein n=1 Tax=Caerostris extrusa TaxID=172846 RepID=A0AAV4WR85_CAEEX|nr:hypothetical protein CEXT_198931 [Caerostris extrusa]
MASPIQFWNAPSSWSWEYSEHSLGWDYPHSNQNVSSNEVRCTNPKVFPGGRGKRINMFLVVMKGYIVQKWEFENYLSSSSKGKDVNKKEKQF